jgi:hypothetical protein
MDFQKEFRNTIKLTTTDKLVSGSDLPPGHVFFVFLTFKPGWEQMRLVYVVAFKTIARFQMADQRREGNGRSTWMGAWHSRGLAHGWFVGSCEQ